MIDMIDIIGDYIINRIYVRSEAENLGVFFIFYNKKHTFLRPLLAKSLKNKITYSKIEGKFAIAGKISKIFPNQPAGNVRQEPPFVHPYIKSIILKCIQMFISGNGVILEMRKYNFDLFSSKSLLIETSDISYWS